MKYGEKSVKEFDIERDLEIWENKNKKNYIIKVTFPEFTALCPRSGYPDFATIYLEYIPNDYVLELKGMKLFINSFRDKYISHEDSANEIFDIFYNRIKPKWMKVVADFYPRGNVHTVIEVDSKLLDISSKD